MKINRKNRIKTIFQMLSILFGTLGRSHLTQTCWDNIFLGISSEDHVAEDFFVNYQIDFLMLTWLRWHFSINQNLFQWKSQKHFLEWNSCNFHFLFVVFLPFPTTICALPSLLIRFLSFNCKMSSKSLKFITNSSKRHKN